MLVNPSPEEISSVKIDDYYLLEGELAEMERIPGKYSDDIKVTIRDENNVLHTVAGFEYPLRYEGGAIEHIRGKTAQIGEKLSVKVYVVIKERQRRTTIGYGRATLLTPSAEREREFNDLRASVERKMTLLSEHICYRRWQSARKHFAELRKLQLTKREHRKLSFLVHGMPVEERPVYDSHYREESLEKAFGVNIEELNPADFLEFARKVLHGEIENAPRPDRADQSYLYAYLMEEPFTTGQLLDLIDSTLKIRFPRLAAAGDSHDETWDDRYLIERSIERLANVKDTRAFELLGWVIEYCLERGYFDNRVDYNEPRPTSNCFGMLSRATRALQDHVMYYDGKLGPEFDFGRLLKWRDTLAAYPYMGTQADEIRTVIEHTI